MRVVETMGDVNKFYRFHFTSFRSLRKGMYIHILGVWEQIKIGWSGGIINIPFYKLTFNKKSR